MASRLSPRWWRHDRDRSGNVYRRRAGRDAGFRFAGHPAQHVALNPIRATEAPVALEQQLFSTMEGLWQERQILDAVIVSWSRELKAEDLDHCLEYSSMKGVSSRRQTGALIMHFFNHQTHHRGQLSTLLYQQGFDIGLTDLLYFIPEES